MTALRTDLRHRETLTRSAVSFISASKESSELINLEFHHVLGDLTGKIGAGQP